MSELPRSSDSEGAERAEQAEKDFRAFVHAVSHDLQEPVSKVITISELLMDTSDKLSEADRHYLSRVHEAGKRMKKIVEDLTESHFAAWLNQRKK